MKIKQFITTMTPDFCFITAFDALVMYEQIDEDCNVNSFMSQFWKLVREGWFEIKEDTAYCKDKTGNYPKLYRRIRYAEQSV